MKTLTFLSVALIALSSFAESKTSVSKEPVKKTSQKTGSGKKVTTLASHFGYKDGHYVTRDVPIKNKKGKVIGKRKKKVWVAQDNGVGSPLLNPKSATRGISTNNTTCERVALPAQVICREFNLPPIPRRFDKSYWEKWGVVRQSAVEVYCHQTGRKAIRPLGDIGPGRSQVKKGVEIDFTHGLMKKLAGTAGLKQGLVKVTYQIYRGYYRNHPYPTAPLVLSGKTKLAKN